MENSSSTLLSVSSAINSVMAGMYSSSVAGKKIRMDQLFDLRLDTIRYDTIRWGNLSGTPITHICFASQRNKQTLQKLKKHKNIRLFHIAHIAPIHIKHTILKGR